jgi:hypothetical protein
MSRVTVNVVGDVELLSFEAFSHASTRNFFTFCGPHFWMIT